MLTSLFLRWVARNSDALVKFVTDLDAKLDTFLAEHDAAAAAFEQDIRNVRDDVQAKIDAIIAEGNEAVESIEAEAAKRAKAAKILLGVKSALPTAE